MTTSWQREHEALQRLGFIGIEGSADRQRAVDTVASLLREIEDLRKKLAAQRQGGE